MRRLDQGRDGNVSSTIALARELRAQPSEDDFDFDAEIERLTREAGDENRANQDS